MNNSRTLTARQFAKEFIHLWNYDVSDEQKRKDIINKYSSPKDWTEFMQSGDDSFLCRLGKKLSFKVSREWGKIDAVYYAPDDRYHYDDLFSHPEAVYPKCLRAIIEHENNEKLQEEMHKLLLWRAPLKVLIFYDYPERDKKENENHDKWLKDKLAALFKLGEAVNAAWPEAQGTEYLFLVGNQVQENEPEPPVWRHLIVKGIEFNSVPAAIQMLNPVK